MPSNSLRNKTVRNRRKNEFDANLVYGAKKFNETTERNIFITGPTEEILTIIKDNGKNRYERIEKYFVKLSECPLCKSRKNYFFLERFGLSFSRCKVCKFVYMNPKIDSKTIDKLYSSDKSSYKMLSKKLQKKMDVIQFKYGLDIVNSYYCNEKRRIIDVGCGAGLSLELAVNNGWREVYGVEPNINYSFSSFPENVKVYRSAFERIKCGDKPFDVIMMWHILEHVYDLNTFMKKANKLLGEKSILLVVVPNLESLATRLIREKSPTFHWSHLNYFCPQSLTYLAEKHGFAILLMDTIISEIENITNYLNMENTYFGQKENNSLFDWLTPEYIHNKLLGSRLLTVMKKK